MAKRAASYRCAECGWATSKWVGRCGECQAWGTVDDVTPPGSRTTAGKVSNPAQPIGAVGFEVAGSHPTGVAEFDRALGGGLVQGAVVLLAGEPGIGKSTLLLEASARWARSVGRALYVSGEESGGQVRLRAERTGGMADDLFLAAETDLSAVLTHIDQVQPSLLILDSVQTVSSSAVEGTSGGVTQVREVAAALSRVAKERNIATILVGHVTKDGAIAGPRALEHLVDVVLHFEGDRHSQLRMLRAVKNRFGPADEVGCFELTEGGIVSLADPTGLFVSRHPAPVAGTCVTVSVEGRRPMLGEIQALVAASTLASPRRANSGLDTSRVAMVLAVLERRAQVRLSGSDVYTSTVGGARLTEPAADLAVLLAVAGAAENRPVPSGLVALGEVGLAGEIRHVTGLPRRLAEAERMGFTSALVPAGAPTGETGLRLLEVGDVAAAITATRAPVAAVS